MSFLNPVLFSRPLGGGAFTVEGVFPDGRYGALFMHTLTAAGGTPPATWSVSAGALPPGLRIDPVSGYVAGVPFSIMSLSVSGGNSTRAGQRYNSQSFVADNAPGGVSFSLASGALPPGLTLDPNTGEILGVVA